MQIRSGTGMLCPAQFQLASVSGLPTPAKAQADTPASVPITRPGTRIATYSFKINKKLHTLHSVTRTTYATLEKQASMEVA